MAAPVALGALVFFLAASPRTEISPQTKREALKVLTFLEKIQAGSPERNRASVREQDFTESELNSYIAFRIETEHSDIMKVLRLKLFEKNRIQGEIFTDLTGQKLPSFLKPKMTLYFEGVLMAQDGRARLDFQKLFLDSQQVPPLLLDAIIYIASKLGKSDAGSINDWYELPSGIHELRTEPGRVRVYF
jgi:hypothetical protein